MPVNTPEWEPHQVTYVYKDSGTAYRFLVEVNRSTKHVRVMDIWRLNMDTQATGSTLGQSWVGKIRDVRKSNYPHTWSELISHVGWMALQREAVNRD